jgi:hypothetical protein
MHTYKMIQVINHFMKYFFHTKTIAGINHIYQSKDFLFFALYFHNLLFKLFNRFYYKQIF